MTLPGIQVENMQMKLSLGGLRLNVLYIRSGTFFQSMPAHTHSGKSYELHYIPAGCGWVIADGVRYPLAPRTLYMTGPDIVHEQIPDPADPMYEYCICFEVLTVSEHPDPDSAALSELFLQTVFWHGADTQQLMVLFEQLAREVTVQSIGYYLSIRNLVEQIVIALIRNYTHNRMSDHKVPQKTLDDKRLVLIESSFLSASDTLTLTQLAQTLGLGIRQTERTLKQHYGLSFTQKKQQARLSTACSLLVTTTLPIGQIAGRVGFSTLESFCTFFKKATGLSAGEFRSRREPADRAVLPAPDQVLRSR
ncbi:helix-turn-helix transcriptional regulator [Saccharibacillus qingshengii]|uniref:helix-turn-helix transcriptional regulator n=1 Tax=Saccharibacillus qingshengii TaxID=1763540 RepID=UPI0015566EDF|nr:AraC family transcriptional regulator [Saccharibacillus qingshengii]